MFLLLQGTEGLLILQYKQYSIMEMIEIVLNVIGIIGDDSEGW